MKVTWCLCFEKSDLRDRSYQRFDASMTNALPEKVCDSRSLFRSCHLYRSRSRLGLEKKVRRRAASDSARFTAVGPL